jgi:hypothetical protein
MKHKQKGLGGFLEKGGFRDNVVVYPKCANVVSKK